eukprot:8868327-Alexandrium_andersonii.AAC.1
MLLRPLELLRTWGCGRACRGDAAPKRGVVGRCPLAPSARSLGQGAGCDGAVAEAGRRVAPAVLVGGGVGACRGVRRCERGSGGALGVRDGLPGPVAVSGGALSGRQRLSASYRRLRRRESERSPDRQRL